MRANQIKVGQQYMAAMDSKTERVLVTVVGRSQRREMHASGAGGMPSIWYVNKTYFEVRDAQNRLSGSLEPKHLHVYPKATELTCAMGCEDCGGMCAEDSAGFAAPNTISEREFAAVLAGDMGYLGIGEGND